MRLVSRRVDLLPRATPEGAAWPAAGACQPAPGSGPARAECARGLPVHPLRRAFDPGVPSEIAAAPARPAAPCMR